MSSPRDAGSPGGQGSTPSSATSGNKQARPRWTLWQSSGAAATLDRLGLASYAVDAHLTAGRVALDLGRRDTAWVTSRGPADLARTAPVLLRLKPRQTS